MGHQIKGSDKLSHKSTLNGVQNDSQKINGTQQEIKADKRKFFQVVLIDVQNFIYFFAPLIFIHLVAW